MIEGISLTDGLTLRVGPVLLAEALVLAALGLALLVLVLGPLNPWRRAREAEPRVSRWPALPPLLAKIGLDALPRPLAWGAVALWTVLFLAFVAGILWVIARLFLIGRSELAADPANLRWYLLTLTATTAALGAVIALPFTVLRTGFNARQTLATEEGLVTDRINAAVESLGAEKTVSRIGRAVTFTGANGAKRTEIEWQGDALAEAEGETREDGGWEVFAESVPNLEVRVGAILALERIAKKNPDDHVQIMEILCAYIRENAKAKDADPAPDLPDEPEIGDGDDPQAVWFEWRRRFGALYRGFRETREPRIDIQTALTVLGRREAWQREIEARWQGDDRAAAFPFDAPYPDPPAYPEDGSPEAHSAWRDRFEAFNAAREARNADYRAYTGYRLDLRNTDLQGYDLSGGCWRGARFEGAQMQGADLRGAQMQGADLRQAQMQGAVLRFARMKGAVLRFARMQGADLWRAQMQGATLGSARMRGANLRQAQMQGAVLRFARMQGADLWRAQMQGASLRQAQMQGAVLRFARMQGADLGRAQMQGADLGGAQMQGADLWDAQMQDVHLGGTVFDTATALRPATMRGSGLRVVDFSELSIEPALLQDTFGDGSVTLPEGMDRPPHWADETLDQKTFMERWPAFQAKLGDAAEAEDAER